MEWPAIYDALATIMALAICVVTIDLPLHRHGLEIAERYRLSVYDGMIVAAALIANCDILYSEDMHDGLLIYGRLRIVNPFTPGAITP